MAPGTGECPEFCEDWQVGLEPLGSWPVCWAGDSCLDYCDKKPFCPLRLHTYNNHDRLHTGWNQRSRCHIGVLAAYILDDMGRVASSRSLELGSTCLLACGPIAGVATKSYMCPQPDFRDIRLVYALRE
eukprot:10177256-Alexandrium_andersonii.AAC.1